MNVDDVGAPIGVERSVEESVLVGFDPFGGGEMDLKTGGRKAGWFVRWRFLISDREKSGFRYRACIGVCELRSSLMQEEGARWVEPRQEEGRR